MEKSEKKASEAEAGKQEKLVEKVKSVAGILRDHRKSGKVVGKVRFPE